MPEAEDASVLRSLGNGERDSSGRCGDGSFAAEDGIQHGNVNGRAEIGSFDLEARIGADSNDQKDITGRATRSSRPALTLDADPLTTGYPGGNRDLNGARLHGRTAAIAARTNGAAHESLAMADRTGIRRLDVKPALGAAEGFVEGDFDRLLNVLTAGR